MGTECCCLCLDECFLVLWKSWRLNLRPNDLVGWMFLQCYKYVWITATVIYQRYRIINVTPSTNGQIFSSSLAHTHWTFTLTLISWYHHSTPKLMRHPLFLWKSAHRQSMSWWHFILSSWIHNQLEFTYFHTILTLLYVSDILSMKILPVYAIQLEVSYSQISYDSYQFTNICYIQVPVNTVAASGHESQLWVLAHNKCKNSGHHGGGGEVATEEYWKIQEHCMSFYPEMCRPSKKQTLTCSVKYRTREPWPSWFWTYFSLFQPPFPSERLD